MHFKRYTFRSVIPGFGDPPRVDIVCLDCSDRHGLPKVIFSKEAGNMAVDAIPAMQGHESLKHSRALASVPTAL